MLQTALMMPYVLCSLALLDLDHEYNAYLSHALGLVALLPLLIATASMLPSLCMVHYERGGHRPPSPARACQPRPGLRG